LDKAQLLVVDDEPASRYGIKKALTQFKLSIQEASEGKQALEMISQLNPDLVILDINLPGMDGLTVLTEATAQSFSPGDCYHCIRFGKNCSGGDEARSI
jgi:CheY-like chemotaxis protein